MSSHFLKGDAVVAKYKSRQMRNYQMQACVPAPDAFMVQQNMFMCTTKTTTVNSLNDMDAKMMYGGRKMNRKNMKN